MTTKKAETLAGSGWTAERYQEWRSAQAWALAREQHGGLARRQLLELGFSTAAIRHRLETGRLWRLAHGVYSGGLPRGTREQRWMPGGST